MFTYTAGATERTMKVQEVTLWAGAQVWRPTQFRASPIILNGNSL